MIAILEIGSDSLGSPQPRGGIGLHSTIKVPTSIVGSVRIGAGVGKT